MFNPQHYTQQVITVLVMYRHTQQPQHSGGEEDTKFKVILGLCGEVEVSLG